MGQNGAFVAMPGAGSSRHAGGPAFRPTFGVSRETLFRRYLVGLEQPVLNSLVTGLGLGEMLDLLAYEQDNHLTSRPKNGASIVS